jgi:hypothetical protein
VARDFSVKVLNEERQNARPKGLPDIL